MFRWIGSVLSRSEKLANISWLAGERVVTLGVSTVASVWVARYLGPDGFGMLSYAISFVTLFGFLAYLGLDSIVTKELVASPEERGGVMGTAFVMKLIGATVACLLIALALVVQDSSIERRWVVVVASASLLFDAVSVIDLWFQSKVASRYAVYARSSALVVAAITKVALILSGATVLAFAGVFAGQAALQAIVLVGAYVRTGGGIRGWRIRPAIAKQFLVKGWPLIISSAGALMYLKMDQVMLGQMSADAEVGIYAAAAKLSELWYFVPAILASTVFPGLIKARHNEELYKNMIQKYLNLSVIISYIIVVSMLMIGGVLIDIAFGDSYSDANSVLRIHILAMPAVFMGGILSKWIVVEDLLMFSMTRHGLGALANVGLNLLLIPRLGAVGAAIATFVSYTVAAYLSCYTDERTRPMGRMMTRALSAPFRHSPAVLVSAILRRNGSSSPSNSET